MELIIYIYPTQRIAREAAKEDCYQSGGTLQVKPYVQLMTTGIKRLYITPDMILHILRGMEISEYYIKGGAKLNQEQRDLLEIRKRG